MARTVSDVFIETLIAAGVRRIYGVVGDSLNGLTEVIRKSKEVDWLHVRHEEVADLVEGFFTPSSTDAHNREIIISGYDEEPEMLESDIRQS